MNKNLIRIGKIQPSYDCLQYDRWNQELEFWRISRPYWGYVYKDFWKELKEYQLGNIPGPNFIWEFNAFLNPNFKGSFDTEYIRMVAIFGKQTLKRWSKLDVLFYLGKYYILTWFKVYPVNLYKKFINKTK